MVSMLGYRPYTYGPASWAPPVVVYGTSWCAASQMVRRYLDRLGVPYRYVDLEYDPGAAARLRWLTGGTVSHPTVYINGEYLVEPSLSELRWALARAGVA
ncbi:MAG TPA: glutaredoxin family protein [Dehalococcoidia bacterium]|jgi:mycoredoxin|nr:glutaredoxin family protein [Dehalococcoidia bacterium]